MKKLKYFSSKIKGSAIWRNYHWAIWVVSVFYSLIKFKKSAEQNFFSLSHSDFDVGWSIIDRPKDACDFEWIVLTTTFKKFWILLLLQVLLSALCRKITQSALPFFYSLYSIIGVTLILGEKAALCFLIYIAVMFKIHWLGEKSYCYALSLLALILKHSSYISDLKDSIVAEENESFLFDVGLTWIMAKGLSFTCDRINLRVHGHITLRDFSVVLAYCLYLPAIFTGPILSYEPFVQQMDKSNIPSKTLFQKASRLVYILLCYVVYEVMLHLIYSSCVQYYPDIASQFDSWSLCGLGYALPAMFFLKYFIIYSMAGSVAAFENFEFPPPPKCISCIHLSSYLWRHFDRGLYWWILRYLYHPLMRGRYSVRKRICAVASSFAFVCLWHNADRAVCAWTGLNFLLVASEMITQALLTSATGKQYLPSFLYEREYRAAFATPHFILMCISSTFFLSNWDIGILLCNRVLFTGVIPLVPIALIMYCGCKVAMDVREWEKNRTTFCR